MFVLAFTKYRVNGEFPVVCVFSFCGRILTSIIPSTSGGQVRENGEFDCQIDKFQVNR